MSTRKQVIDVRLPRKIVDRLKRISNLSGLPMSYVITVICATYLGDMETAEREAKEANVSLTVSDETVSTVTN